MIDKYLNTENATITIEYSSFLDYFFENNLNDILKMNFKKIDILINSNEIEKLKDILCKYDFKSLPVFININNFKGNREKIDYLNDRYYIVIKCNDIINYIDDVYYEIKVTGKNTLMIIKLLDKYENIVLDIDINRNNLREIYDALDTISSKTKRKQLMIKNMFMPKKLIIDCPYNIYVGNENSNRNYGNMIPRNIYIDNSIYASNFKESSFIIGNIKDKLSEVLHSSEDKDGYKKFVKYNKILFTKYLNQFPYDMVDVNYLLREVIDNDTSS